ncbi:unnamed protein product [Mycena citricolor]|uniref:amidase n=1 Tax=Mycena citricolor TaxID=2018698 RepID=A0AAD2HL26_9AGAR|nr:unnamed protein product [Mycena citricolor]
MLQSRPVDMEPRWPKAAQDAVHALNNLIPEHLRLGPEFVAQYPAGSDVRAAAAASGLLSPLELEITDVANDATSILERIRQRDWTAVQVTLAFAKRAAIAQQLLSCLCDFFLEDALRRARELDEYQDKTGRLVGPLHGLPISIKGHMDVAGRKSNAGFSGDLTHEAPQKHGLMAQILYDAGAVFYVKTNLPQSIMHLETYSFWGQTLNPFNTSLTPGGSSGGCSALIAFGGSPLGIGSDIGGSLRSPAAACGLWTLKPTAMRVPRGSARSPVPGSDSIQATYGPLCRSLRDVDLWFSVVLGTQPWLREHNLVAMPWTVPEMKRPLRIGVMWNDEVVKPNPQIRRALELMVRALEKDQESFQVVDYKPFKHADIVELAHGLYFPDGGVQVRARAAVNGEPLLPLTEWVLTRPRVKSNTVSELWQLHVERDGLRAAYLEHWNSQGVDLVLCPVGPTPAPVLGTSKYLGYTSVWNLLDYPALVFPTGLYCDRIDGPNGRSGGLEFARAPLCLQLVGRRFADEMIVSGAKQLTKLLPVVPDAC